MIRVDISNFTAERAPIPAELRGLDTKTLTNLQTEGPTGFVQQYYPNYEWWPEIDITGAYNPLTTDLGEETFTVNQGDKTVSFSRALIPKPDVFDVVVTSVTGVGRLSGNNVLFYAKQLQDIVITVSVNKPDGTFLVMPILLDTGLKPNIFATVSSNAAVFSFQFPEAGNWVANEELLNTAAQGDDIFTFSGISAVVGL